MAHRLVVGAALLLLFVLPVVSQAQTVVFLDEGTPASTLLDGSTARIRVTDAAANITPGRDRVDVVATSVQAADSVTRSLLETGPGTGVFEGVVELEPGLTGSGTKLSTYTVQGPPAVRDTVRATYSGVTASVSLAGSILSFFDDWGREGTSFVAGYPIGLRVRDELGNDPLLRDTLTVLLEAQTSFDSETVILRETGMNTGVFEAVLRTNRLPGDLDDGELQVGPSEVVTGTVWAEDGMTSMSVQAQMAGSAVVLTDGDGNPAADYVEAADVHILVINPDFTGPALYVQVTAALTGDAETISLPGIGGGRFAGNIPTVVSTGTPPPGFPGDGALEIGEVWGPPLLLDTVTVSYTGGDGTVSAGAPFIAGRLSFLNARGEAASSYAAGTEARVRLEYHGYDTPGRLDLATVRLVNVTTGEEEYMQLIETGRDTGVFIGSMPLTGNGSSQWFNGTLNAQPGHQIRVQHGDIPQPVADITDVSLEFLDERGEPTDEIVESGIARVRMWSVSGNANPSIANTASVEMRTLLSNDLETLTLTETGPDTNVFEGSMALEMGSYGYPNGKLQTANSGMPDYRPDEVMARFGSAEATARTIGARIEFFDAGGRKVSGYVGGEIARLRIVDPFRSAYGNAFPVTLMSLGTGDSESVMMRETSSGSTVFEGSMPTALSNILGTDARVAVNLLDAIEVRLTTSFNPIEMTKRAEIRASSVAFVDAAGRPVDVYLESSRAYVRVVSSAANTYPGTAQTVSVALVSELGPDSEMLTLTETGPNTGVFEGSIQMRLGFSSVLPGNGILETLEAGGISDPPHEFDTLRATYGGGEGTAVAQAGLTGSRTWFGDAAGAEVLSYTAGGTAYLWVEDQNWNDALWNNAHVMVRSLTTGDQELLMLLETSRTSGIFTRSLELASGYAVPGDGRLQVQTGEQIEMVHQDYLGNTASSAVAGIDALALEFFDEAGEPTVELLASGEARVRMFNLGGNANPGTAETVSVTVRSLRSGDQEPVLLTETGPDTGVFEGSVPMAVGPGSPNNGTLETRNSGSPAYLPDEVTALSEPYQAKARVLEARITFFDLQGRETTSYAAGESVGVRVTDYSRRSPGVRDNIVVHLVSVNGADSETIYPYETGYDTGVFEGSAGTLLSTYASLGDYQLRVIPEDQVVARYQALSSPNPIESQVTVTGNAVRFVDAAGQPVSVYLESSRVYVQVLSAASNTDLWSVQTVSVQLVSELTPDTETLTLTEIGSSSGIFAGSIPMRLSLSGVTPGNGTLETVETGTPGGLPPHEFDTVRATFSDAVGTSVARTGLTGSRTWFADAVGQEAVAFAAGGTAFIRVEDQNRNQIGQWNNDVQVMVRSLTTGDQENLVMSETTRDSGIFAVSLELERSATATPGDGRLQVQPGEQIEAVHQDYMGATASSAIADITEASLEFIDEAGETTAELMESGDARLRLFSPGSNSDSGTAETLTADVQTLRSGDQETVTLTETGPDTGVFEGSIPMGTGTGYPGSGTLETRNSGNPEYLPDLVTARSGPRLATAQVVSARILFLDSYGRVVESYAAGETVGVRVVDHNRNWSIQGRDSLPVYLMSEDTSDGESLELEETGADTGVFEGSLPTAYLPAGVSNGVLEVDLEDQIEVSHTLVNNPNGLTATADITGNTVLFLDAAGRPATVYLESSRARVRVVSTSSNTGHGADTVTVQLVSELTPDTETLTLTETGPSTAVFEGSIPTRLSTTGVVPGNGIVEVVESGHPVNQPPHELDTLRATFTDAAGTSVARIGFTGSRTWFTNAAGEVVTSFPWFGTAYIRVEDQNRNQPGQWDRVQVQLRSESQIGPQFGGDQESLELLETTRDSGIFTGSIRLTHNDLPTHGDGLLGADPGDPIEASHQDYLGATFSRAEAVIAAASIEFFDETGAPTHVLLESGTARVRVFSRLSNESGDFDTLTVQVRSLHTGDLEPLVLNETGGNTSLFESALPMSLGPVQSGDYVLQTRNSGNPEYEPDQVTASFSSVYGNASATAETVAMRATFIDIYGRETSSFAAGETVGLRVVDHNRNDPQNRDSLPAYIMSRDTGDGESLELQETGNGTAVFEGSLPTAVNGAPSPSNGLLTVEPGDQIEASLNPVDNPNGLEVQADITGHAVLFIDTAGEPATVYLESSRAYVRVVSTTADVNPLSPDTTTVQLRSELGADLETLTLTETGAKTAVFEGSIPLRLISFNPVQQGNGILETVESGHPVNQPPHEFDTLRATYSDGAGTSVARIGLTGSRTSFVNAAGQEVSYFAVGGTARIRVEDHNWNSPVQTDFVQVHVRSVTSGDQDFLMLQETGTNTGVFTGSILLTAGSSSTGDGKLQVQPGGRIEATHQDYAGATSSGDQADIVDSATEFIDEAGQPTRELFESGTARVRMLNIYANNNPSVPNTATVQLQSQYGGDTESVLLTETGPDTSLFEGSIAMRFGWGSADGFLQTRNSGNPSYLPDEVRTFDGLSTATVLPSRLVFLNMRGQEVSAYPQGAPVRVRVTDHNRNYNPAQVDQSGVGISSLVSNDIEGITLTETGPNTGVFEGSIPSSGTGSIGTDGLLVAPAGLVQASLSSFNAPVVTTRQATILSTFAPVAAEDFIETVEDIAAVIPVLANDTGDGTLTVVSVTQPAHGSAAINPDGTVTYTPVAEYYGPDSFTYVIVDSQDSEGLGTVTITVTSDNRAPTPAPDSATTPEDQSVVFPILTNDTDPDNDPIQFVTMTFAVPGGSVSVNLSNYMATYTPPANFSGQATFEYTIRDPEGLTASTTVTITVTPVNDAPVARADSATVAEDGSVTINVLANDTDVENNTLSVTSVTQGANGTAVINPDKTVTYTPNANFNGTGTFTYTISDGNGGTATATVTVTVSGVNDAPVANDDTATVSEDGSVSITVLGNDTDPENHTLSVTAVTQGTNGSVAINPDKTVTYAPAANFNGADSFTYTISDGNGGTDTATVNVTITSVNDSPVANADAATVAEDGSVNITVLGNDTDPENNTLDVTSVTQGTNGTVTLNANETVTYAPNSNFNGTDSFTYTISDGNGGTATATVTVTINAVNDSPVANADTATVAEDGSVNITVLGNDTDPENNTLDVTSVTQGTNGTVTLNANETVTYAPNANFNGTDSFTYTISDGNGGTATGTVTITVTAVNDSPVANADAATVAEDGSVTVTVLGNDTDPENNALDVTSVTQGANGSVALNANDTVTYTPSANFNGPDAFTYTISDGNGGSATATVAVTITSVNDGPVANADTATMAEDGSVIITVLGNDSDPENNTLSVSSVTQGAHGSVTVNANQTVTYTPAANYNGPDAFTYTISDGNGGTATAGVTVTITAVNDAPVALNDTASTTAETLVVIAVLSNDLDVDGPALSIASVTQPAHGTVTVNANQTINYTPASAYVGPDSFTYTLTGGTAPATVNVTVNAPPRVATNLQVLYELEEGSGTTVTDTSGVGTPLNLTIGSASAVTWISGGGLSVNSATLIQSAGAATKVIAASQSTNAITLEAWVDPANLTQTGPAPIVTVSQQSNKRNFALGQSGNRWDGRLRTTATNQAGLGLASAVGTATLNLTHVVYTRDAAGNVRIYVNGVQSASTTLTGNFSSWTGSYKLGLVNELSSGTPWLGELYLVAIYNRALSAGEVRQNWLAGE